MKNKIISKNILIFVFLMMFTISFVFIEANLFMDYKEKLNYFYLAKYMSKETSYVEPDKDDEAPILEAKTERMLKLEELHSQNADVVAWIEIPRDIY